MMCFGLFYHNCKNYVILGFIRFYVMGVVSDRYVVNNRYKINI